MAAPMARRVETEEVEIAVPGGRMPGVLCTPGGDGRAPAVLVLMEAFGLTGHIRRVAARIAAEGYVTFVPDLYWRSLPDNKFGYDQVPEGMKLMLALRDEDVVADLRASLAFLKARPRVAASALGVTGFCMGGGFSFLTACALPGEIAAVAPFYGMVRDAWIDEVQRITAPVYLFFGGADPFIPPARVRQLEERFRALGKPCRVKVYAGADHGFFCDERASYHPEAAADAWLELTGFFAEHLKV
jgi:carboxymethylenebutenolidase